MVCSETKKIYHLNERLQTKSDRRTKEVIEREKEKRIRQIEAQIAEIYQLKFQVEL